MADPPPARSAPAVAALPRGARISIEAGATLGWQKWIGDRGIAIGLDRYGASAPGATNMNNLGFTADAVVSAVKSLL
jgi:transketolase